MRTEEDGVGGVGGSGHGGENSVSFEFINGTLHQHFVKGISVACFHQRIQ